MEEYLIKCLICNKEFENFKKITSHIRSHKISSKEYYDQYFKKEYEGYCLICRKHTKYVDLGIGYRQYCNIKCQHESNEVKNKTKQTNLDRYGVDHPNKNSEIIKKRKETNIKKYGVENVFQSKEIKEKIKQTNLDKYGAENPFQSEEIKKKIKQTNLKKFGVENPSQNEEIKKRKIRKRINDFLPILKEQLKYLNIELLDNNYINCYYLHDWKCLKCGLKFKQIWDRLREIYTCPKCFPRNKSKGENELLKYLNILYNNIISGDRIILNGKELDIYIPDKNMAIEFDGLYYHSEYQGKDKNYHLNKTKLCESKGIRLIHIFEDEWILKQDIVKSRLKQILGINNSISKIYARNCVIEGISSKIKNEFLNKFHIQGEDKSNIKLGAFYNDELISIMTFSHGNISRKKLENKDWELSRFCSNSNYRIPGIASKLLSYFKKNHEWKEIISYADKRWSQGNLYYKIGFELDSITKPNYWYIKGLNRIHRFNLRKRYDEPKDIPEWILRQKDGYYRIWDCGHYKFIMKNKEFL